MAVFNPIFSVSSNLTKRRLFKHGVIDLILYKDLTEAGKKDNINYTVDYELVFRSVEKVVSGNRFKLLEAIAQNIADMILHEFNPEKVTVVIRKRKVPIKCSLDYVGVEITRTKG